MDKYTNTLFSFFRIIIGVFCIILGLVFIGVSVWVSTFSDIASMILLAALLGGGCLIDYGVGFAFLGDEYKATNIVRDGNTVFAPEESTKYLQRRKIVTFIGFISYLLLAVYYIVRTIVEAINMEYLLEIDYNVSIVALICFAVVSLVVAFCLFMLYKRTKHIDLQED